MGKTTVAAAAAAAAAASAATAAAATAVAATAATADTAVVSADSPPMKKQRKEGYDVKPAAKLLELLAADRALDKTKAVSKSEVHAVKKASTDGSIIEAQLCVIHFGGNVVAVVQLFINSFGIRDLLNGHCPLVREDKGWAIEWVPNATTLLSTPHMLSYYGDVPSTGAKILMRSEILKTYQVADLIAPKTFLTFADAISFASLDPEQPISEYLTFLADLKMKLDDHPLVNMQLLLCGVYLFLFACFFFL
jgi:hypothetical protein